MLVTDPAVPWRFSRAQACHGERYQEADVVCAGFAAWHVTRLHASPAGTQTTATTVF